MFHRDDETLTLCHYEKLTIYSQDKRETNVCFVIALYVLRISLLLWSTSHLYHKYVRQGIQIDDKEKKDNEMVLSIKYVLFNKKGYKQFVLCRNEIFAL